MEHLNERPPRPLWRRVCVMIALLLLAAIAVIFGVLYFGGFEVYKNIQ